jgi:hypothetical protein
VVGEVKMRSVVIIISVYMIAACSIPPDVNASAIDGASQFPLKGNSGNISFALSEEVFIVERAPVSQFLLAVLFFPFLLL